MQTKSPCLTDFHINLGGLVLSILLVFSSPIFAAPSGGGGGFNSPSRSAPAIDPVATYQEGVAELEKGNNRAAEKAFKKVIRVSKNHAPSQYFLGLALFNQEKFKKAKRPFEKALKYNSKLVSAHGYLGVVYQKTNKLNKAEEQRQILIKKQAACGECKDKTKISNALLQIDGHADAGTSQSSSIIESDPNVGDQRYIKAISLINQGDFIAALSSLSESALVFGPHPDVLTYQGFANRKLGNRELAFDYYQAALKISPDHRGANEYLGEFYVETGRLDLAQAQLQKLERICEFGCEEVQELKRWIAAAS